MYAHESFGGDPIVAKHAIGTAARSKGMAAIFLGSNTMMNDKQWKKEIPSRVSAEAGTDAVLGAYNPESGQGGRRDEKRCHDAREFIRQSV